MLQIVPNTIQPAKWLGAGWEMAQENLHSAMPESMQLLLRSLPGDSTQPAALYVQDAGVNKH